MGNGAGRQRNKAVSGICFAQTLSFFVPCGVNPTSPAKTET
jgi:hypothetical protein